MWSVSNSRKHSTKFHSKGKLAKSITNAARDRGNFYESFTAGLEYKHRYIKMAVLSVTYKWCHEEIDNRTRSLLLTYKSIIAYVDLIEFVTIYNGVIIHVDPQPKVVS